MNIALIGFMASGKTTVGRIIADILGYRFIDTDEEIVRRTGRDISEIFSSDGETAFRVLERRLVAEASGLESAVIACGGGVVLDRRNVDSLRRTSRLVLLTADIDEILNRVKGDRSRPLLDVEDRKETVAFHLKERAQIYWKAADAAINTTGLTPMEVAGRVIRLLETQE